MTHQKRCELATEGALTGESTSGQSARARPRRTLARQIVAEMPTTAIAAVAAAVATAVATADHILEHAFVAGVGLVGASSRVRRVGGRVRR